MTITQESRSVAHTRSRPWKRAEALNFRTRNRLLEKLEALKLRERSRSGRVCLRWVRRGVSERWVWTDRRTTLVLLWRRTLGKTTLGKCSGQQPALARQYLSVVPHEINHKSFKIFDIRPPPILIKFGTHVGSAVKFTYMPNFRFVSKIVLELLHIT